MPKATLNPRRSPLFFIILFLGVLVLILLFSGRVFFVPKLLMLLFVILAVAAMGKIVLFLRDWSVFIGFLYLFDSLRGSIYIATCQFGLPVYTTYVIKLEQLLFQTVPSVWLQNLLLRTQPDSGFGWFEKLITIAHGSHFVAFLTVGFIIWLYQRQYFRFFKVSFYLTISLGLAGYFALPTVPPWMASSVFGLLPRIIRFNAVIYNLAIPDISAGFDTNPIAAMPSLHAAFPFLCGLILWKIYRWKSWPFYLYALLMLFTIVYTGDHYVVDLLAGIILGLICYAAAWSLTRKDFEAGTAGPPPGAGGAAGLKPTVKAIAIGLAIMTGGILVGSYNRGQFVNRAIAYNIYVPRYVDFFRPGEEFGSNYEVQYYLGGHHFMNLDFERALFHYERCLSLSRTDREREQSETGIRKCRANLDRRPKDHKQKGQ
jgi:membrane-associated phospholipid phosphatase